VGGGTPDGQRWRLFVAADLRDDDAEAVLRATAALRARHPTARWTTAEQLHLTMVFLGSTDPEAVPRLQDAIADVTASWRPFAVTMGEGDGFTQRKGGGVAWLRVADGYEPASRLSRELDDAMASRAFRRIGPRPHLTLARKVTEDLLEDVRRTAPELRLGWTVDNIVLFRSHTDPGGGRYEELSRHAFSWGP
jgi:RNA 2',3'-cyclic 3'-phosphodiesterase